MDSLIHPPISGFSPARFGSPLEAAYREAHIHFIDDDRRVLAEDSVGTNALPASQKHLSFEMAGPRRHLFFNPYKTTAAIVTCGGLCPGLNEVIRGLVLALYQTYRIGRVLGVRYGYQGFTDEIPPLELTPQSVAEIRGTGGTMLGSSRGPQAPATIVDWLEQHAVDMLFVVGGDGTIRGAQDIVKEIEKRGRCISVVGLPKTIDNDFVYMDKSFGFETAFAEAVRIIRCAHSEARGCRNGIGLVKLMGRESGFIAAHAALAEACVNFVLVPEVPFHLEGARGLLHALERRLTGHGHAVVVVAEGAGQDLFPEKQRGTDASGNPRLGDIGLLLKERIESHFQSAGKKVNLKYIDPSYVIRSVPTNAQDEIFCMRLAQNAVHAAMAGKTDLVVGRWHEHYIHLPTAVAVSHRRQLDPQGDLWMAVLQSTGQAAIFP